MRAGNLVRRSGEAMKAPSTSPGLTAAKTRSRSVAFVTCRSTTWSLSVVAARGGGACRDIRATQPLTSSATVVNCYRCFSSRTLYPGMSVS
jgi:hypothetical protein